MSFGRPLGLLLSWLEIADHLSTKAEHKESELLLRLTGPENQAWRARLREEFVANVPGAEGMLAMERPPIGPDDIEPADVGARVAA